MLNISMKKFRSLSIPIPPENLQKKFTSIVEKIAGIKSQYQLSLTKLENLYGALSQSAFKGELDLSRIPLVEYGLEEIDETKEPEMDEVAIEETTKEIEQILSNPQDRESFLRVFFDNYIAENAGKIIDLDDFWGRSEIYESDQHGETVYISNTDYSWGQKDYDNVKKWIFDMLEERKLEQQFVQDEEQQANNKIQVMIKE
jgi:type I restriction enzyme, S subunit